MDQHNRIETILEKWNERERRLAQVTGGNKNNIPFLREKLHAIENLQVRYAGSMSLDERLLAQSEIRGLRAVLYSNRILRMLRAVITPIRQQIQINRQQKAAVANTDKLTASLVKLGFGEVIGKATQQIQQGKESFSIPLSYYPGEKERVDFTLNFKRNELGRYELMNYNATLKNEAAVVRSHTFTAEQNLGLSQHEVANLLAGRAILKQEVGAPWKNERWLQLDLTDKDAEGNHRVRVINADESLSLEAVIKAAGISKAHLGMDADNAAQLLKQGDQIRLSVNGAAEKQTYYIEANPVQRSINVYDDQKRRVTLDQALKPKPTQTKIISLKPEKVQAKRVRRSKGISH